MQQAAPFYSIIIATYNSASTIETCLKTILDQDYPYFEVLIQDGNSTDDTLLLIRRLGDHRIQVSSEPDGGIYDAMNKAIERVKGGWLLFLGSDDSLYNRQVLKDTHHLIRTNPASKFVYGDVYTSLGYVQRYDNYTYQKLLYTNICHQAIFYHHSLFATMRYNTSYRLFADWELNLKVFRNANHPLYTGRCIANFSLSGASGQWYNDPEYVKHFANKSRLMLHYRGRFFLWSNRISRLPGKLKRAIHSFVK